MGGGYMHVLPSAWSGDSISGGRIRRAKMERAIAGRISWGFAAPCSRGQGLFRSDLLREACRAARPIVCGRGRVEDGSRARAHPRRSSLAFVLLHVHELPRAQRAQRAHSDTAGRRSSACVRAVCSGSGCSTQARLRFRLPSAQRPTFLSPPQTSAATSTSTPSAPPFAAVWSSPESSLLWPREALQLQLQQHARPAKASDIRHSNPRCSCLSLTFGAASHRQRHAPHRTAPHRSTRDHQHLARAHLPIHQHIYCDFD